MVPKTVQLSSNDSGSICTLLLIILIVLTTLLLLQLLFCICSGFHCCFQRWTDRNLIAIHSFLLALQPSKLPYLMRHGTTHISIYRQLLRRDELSLDAFLVFKDLHYFLPTYSKTKMIHYAKKTTSTSKRYA